MTVPGLLSYQQQNTPPDAFVLTREEVFELVDKLTRLGQRDALKCATSDAWWRGYYEGSALTYEETCCRILEAAGMTLKDYEAWKEGNNA